MVEGTEGVAEHVARARSTLDSWARRVAEGMTQDEFMAAAQADIEESEGRGAAAYASAAPLPQSFVGLERYWRKRREREAAATAAR